MEDTSKAKTESKSNSLESKVIKRIEVRYSSRAFFRYPRVKRYKYSSIQRADLSDSEWAADLMKLNEWLRCSFIPVWLWIIILIISGGLLGWVILPWQKKKTRKAARLLREFVEKRNDQFHQARIPIQYEIPLPSKKGVIINVCIMERKI